MPSKTVPPKPKAPAAANPAPPAERPHRGWKITGIVIAVVILLIIITAIVLPFVINPNDFKPEIARAVKDKTGRELSIPGNIKLSIFPWLGVEIGPLQLANASGFGNTPFAAVNETDVHVRFWPLLRGKVEVGTIKLDGLNLDLARDANGRSNWQDILDHLQSTPSAAPAGEKPSGNGLQNLRLQGLDISNSGLRWTDAQKHQQYTVSNFNLDLGEFASGKPVRLSTDFDFSGTNPQLQGHAQFKGTLIADFASKTYTADNAKLVLSASGDAVPGGQANTTLMWQHLIANLDTGTAAINGLNLSAYGLSAHLDADAKNILKPAQLAATGTFKLDDFSPRAVLTALGRGALADTRDSSALSHASAAFNFLATHHSADITGLKARLDDSTLSGRLSVKDFKSQALGFDLNLDQFNADRYLPPQKAATPAQPREPTDINKVSIPVRTLRGLNLDGHLHIGQFTLLNAQTANLDFTVSAHKGLVKLNPLSAQLYGGTLAGNVMVDASSDTPIVTEDLALQNVQAGGLVQDLFKVKRLSGTANLHMTTRALGPTVGEMRHTLDGRVNFALKNGALEGMNVWDAIDRAYALVKHQPAPPPAPNRTEFADMHGSASIHNGVLDNRDFSAALPFLSLSGEGKLDLAELTVDYSLKAHVTGTPRLNGQNDVSGLQNATLPLRISGTFSNLSVRPDLGGAVHARVETEVSKKKSELRNKLKNKLEGILHGPPPG